MALQATQTKPSLGYKPTYLTFDEWDDMWGDDMYVIHQARDGSESLEDYKIRMYNLFLDSDAEVDEIPF